MWYDNKEDKFLQKVFLLPRIAMSGCGEKVAPLLGISVDCRTNRSTTHPPAPLNPIAILTSSAEMPR
jgi:hypothetical protein